jgi:hypothetical protein
MGVVTHGTGPSSKVSTTSFGPRKLCSLSRWVIEPKIGPPLVSISITRETPSAFAGSLQSDAREGDTPTASMHTANAVALIRRRMANRSRHPLRCNPRGLSVIFQA